MFPKPIVSDEYIVTILKGRQHAWCVSKKVRLFH